LFASASRVRLSSSMLRSKAGSSWPELASHMARTRSGALPALDRSIELLSRTREALANNNSVGELVEAGHAARTRYDSFPRPDIVTIFIGAPNWRDELAAAGRAGGVIRSALPSLDIPG
jgi:prephenate dehydrogenase